jgi:uncharacterized delta-60 repeat protein
VRFVYTIILPELGVSPPAPPNNAFSMKQRTKTTRALITFLGMLLFLIETAFSQIGGYDPSFSPGTITQNEAPVVVRVVSALSSGKVLIAGDFTKVGGLSQNRIARLTSAGATDSSFNIGTGANGPIRAMLVQTDGKILIGGDFTTYNGVTRNRIARLSSEGALDTTFNPSTGANAPVHAIALYESNILIGGEFTTFNGTARNRIARVTSTGILDSSFDSSRGANGTVHAIAIGNNYSYGNIYVGGAFTQFGGQTRNRLVMLDSSGNVDFRFNRGTGFDGPVYALWANKDNYYDRGLYVGGDFTSYEGGIRSRIARFNLNSNEMKLDQGFNLWADGSVRSITPDGTNGAFSSSYKILVGGDFTLINGAAKNRIARVEISRTAFYGDGVYANPELAFNPSPGPNGAVFSTAYFADGRVAIAGAFSQVSGLETPSVARLYGDIGLNLPGTPSSPVTTAVSESQIVLKWSGGAYTTSTHVERSLDGVSGWTGISPSGSPVADRGLTASTTYFYRSRGYNYNGYGLYSAVANATTNSAAWTGPGVLDPTASPNSGANGSVYAFAKQTDGKLIAVGDFSQINGITTPRIARLNTNLTVDVTFNPGTGPNSGVKAAVIQPDGKILIVGDFSTVAGVSRKYVARLNGDGSLDTAFATSLSPDGSVRALALLPDGRIMIGGDFSIINGFSRDRLARLDANGVLDPTFSVAANSSVECMESYPDGRVLIGGSFSTVQGVSKSGIARLNADGLLDTSFNTGSGASDVRDLAFDTAGRIFLCGGFSSYNGVSRRYLAALDANGNLDSTFDPGAGPSSSVESIAIDGGGKILIGGDFETVAGIYRVRLARLDPTGGLDPTFQIGLGFNSAVRAIEFQNGTQVAVGGSFSSFNGNQANYLTRLNAGTSALPFIVSATALPSGIVGVSYSTQLNAVGGVPPYTWSVTSGSLPSGIVLSADGSLHGISPLGGNETFGVRVTDSNAVIHEKNLNLLIRDITAGLAILEATYGANGLSVNAEPYITANIVNDSVTMSVSNSIFGGDPNYGVVKTLYVRYQDTSGHYQTSVQEGGNLVLPNSANQRLPMDFTQWLSTRFPSSELLNPAITGANADPEHDGVSNLLEFAFGGNPKLNDAALIWPTFDIVGNRPRITFRCDSYRTTLTYTVESTTNLLSDSWVPIARSVGGGTTTPVGGFSTVVDAGTGTRSVRVSPVNELTPGSGFLRVKVQGP